MKKIISAVLTLAMAGAMSVTAFAASDTLGQNGTRDIDVNAKYTDSTQTPDSYSVDVEWGEMNFTYTIKGNHVWNKDTHEYTRDKDNDGWTSSGNSIKVTNHSNKDVTVNFTFTNTSTDRIDGSFNNNDALLQSGVGKTPKNADSVTSALSLSGVMSENETNAFAKIGYVTVALS